MNQYFPLPQISDTKFINVSTYKGNNRDIITVAQCVDVAKHDGYATETFHVFADFSKLIAHSFMPRRTEKLVTKQHTSFVENSDAVKSLVEDAIAFYQK